MNRQSSQLQSSTFWSRDSRVVSCRAKAVCGIKFGMVRLTHTADPDKRSSKFS
jgi:hypothetical protein